MAAKSEPDTRDCFFTLKDYYEMSCVHYILMNNLYEKSRGINGNGPLKRQRIGDFSGNVPAKKMKLSDGSPQQNVTHDDLFSPPRPIEIGVPLATLLKFEHKLYLDLKAKFASMKEISGSASERQDLEILSDLEKKVQKERNKVNNYLYHNACTARRDDYFTISAVAHQFVSDILKRELEHSLKYPRFYSTQKIIPLLAPSGQMKEEIPFTFSKVVLKLGCPSPFLVPTASNNCMLNVKYESLCKRFPPSEIGDEKVHPSKKHISRDDIAHKLAATYDADIVISLSSLKVLMDNVFPELEHDWEIPVIVSEDPGGTSGGPRKHVFVEKSIPPLSLSVRARNKLFFNYALKCKFTHTYASKSRKYNSGYAVPFIPDGVKPVSEEEQAELKRKISDLAPFDDMFEVSEKVCELDTFGVSLPEKPSKPKIFRPSNQNDMSDKTQSLDNISGGLKFSDEDEDEDEVEPVDEKDKPFMEGLKGMILSAMQLEEARNSGKTSVVDAGMDGNGFAQCLSPMSSVDSEHDKLVIDCDGEEKKSALSAPQASKRKASTSNEIVDNCEITPVKNCDLGKNEHSNAHDEDEDDDDTGKKKHKAKQLPPFDDSDSNNGSKKPDIVSPKAKKLQDNTGNIQFKNPLNQILVSQHKMLKPQDNINDDASNIVLPQLGATDPMDEIAKDYPPLSQPENVTYSLWHLGQLKILLRSEVDSQVQTNKCPTTPAFLFPKLEYQLKYGFEVTTPSELMQQWVVLYTHPGSHVVKVRINTTRSMLAMLEEVNLPNLPQEKTYFDPKRAIFQLHVILDTLKSLPEGQYLLIHKKGEQTLTLKKAVNTGKRGPFDLHASIRQRLEEIDNSQDVDTLRKEVPWLPIDSSIALPEHKRDSRIPGCFYPIDFNRKKRKQYQQQKSAKKISQKQNKNKGQAKKS